MHARSADSPTLSIVIPAKDEAGSIGDVLREIASGPLSAPEIVVVDDGSSDGTAEAVSAAGVAGVRLMRHSASAGKSRALRTGIRAARGDIIVTMDGDGQNDPQYLNALVAPLLDDPKVGLVAGQRAARHDGAVKKMSSRIANRVRRAMLKDDTRDTACGLKAMRRSAYLTLPFFDNNHRFFPSLFLREGWAIAHVDVADRVRHSGVSKYGMWDRLAVGVPDLLGVWWLTRRARSRPVETEISVTDGEAADAAQAPPAVNDTMGA